MKTGLLWVSYRNDFPWFEMSARSFAKFAKGWDFAKCVVPNQDFGIFRPACESAGIYLTGFDEWPGKGFNHHQAMQCYGDLHFPEAEVIFHIDSDSIFSSECSPSDWLPGGLILLPFTDYVKFLDGPVGPDEMANFMGCSGKRIDLNRGQYLWKFAVDYALGFPAERECMAWMPLAHYRGVYSKARDTISHRFSKSFESYVSTCRNEFPQTFAEFNTLGAVAHQFFQEKYCWWNISTHGYPFAGRVTQCWSHGGFDRPHEFGKEVGGYQTPRQLFQRLGLI